MRWLAKFLRSRAAIAATEFALVLPVGILLLVGTSEVGTLMLLDRKVTRAAHIAADLIAQTTSVSESDVNNVFDAMEAILLPFPGSVSMIITSVYQEPGEDDPSVDWSESRGGTAETGTYTLPSGLVADGESVIVARVTYQHTPLFDDFILGEMTITDVAYLKPRRTLRVTGP
ncbi:MAG: pilus assembly protein [Alphaproteobacteria bacterium]|jgi:Flp pilus assembly protein TadG|nr:pilus assembly protein [Alphaproteobacteria bacterium]MDP6563682.1 pilus assembly protein [Alphaproteobacteria bacterium]MDP6816280.1 pilus assembly protein [Alphaproteobacteria bacterium]